MTMNPDVDCFTKTLSHWKMLRKTQKTTTYWATKEN